MTQANFSNKVIYHFQDLTINPEERSVFRNTEKLAISGLSYELFVYLLERPEETISFDEFIEHVWQGVTVNEETVTQRIKLLRQALGDSSKNPVYIQSVRSRGYRLIGQVTCKKNSLPSRFRKNLGLRLSLSLILLAIISTGTFVYLYSPSQPTEKQSSESAQLLERARFYAQIGQEDDLKRGIELFTKLLEQEPNNIAALAGLSFAYSSLVARYNWPVSNAETAESYARAALKLAPEDSNAWSALGFSFDCRGWINQALDAYQKSYNLDTSNASALADGAHLKQVKGQIALSQVDLIKTQTMKANLRFLDLTIARNLELLGETQEAERLLKKTFDLQPDNVFAANAYAKFLYHQGRFADTKRILEHTRRRNIQLARLEVLAAELALLDNNIELARQHLESANDIDPEATFPIILNAIYGAQTHSPEFFDNTMNDLLSAIDHGDLWPSNFIQLGLIYLAKGEIKRSFHSMNQAVEHGFRDRNYLTVSPLFINLRHHNEFSALLQRIDQLLEEEKQLLAEIKG